MANTYVYPAFALTGGGTGALDAIDGAHLVDGDRALVMLTGKIRYYKLDADSGAAENSPWVIAPDSNGGSKRWILQSEGATVWYADPTEADHGATGNGATVKAIADALPNGGVIVIEHSGASSSTDYVFATSYVLPKNILLRVEQGAKLVVGDGKVLVVNSPLNIIASHCQEVFSGSVEFQDNGGIRLRDFLSGTDRRNYLVDVQNVPDLQAGGKPFYLFSGGIASDDKIVIAHDANLSFEDEMSLFAFCNLATRPYDQNLFAKYASTGNQREYRFYRSQTGLLLLAFGDPADGTYEGAKASDFPVDINANRVYACVYSAGEASLYQDGMLLQASIVGAVPATLFQGNSVATISGTLGQIYGGMQRVMAFNKALSPDEIRSFSSGAPIPYCYLGASRAELVADGDFPSADNWTLLNGSTISGGKATVVANGSIGSSSSNWSLKQTGVFPVLKQVKLRFEARQIAGSGNLHVGCGYSRLFDAPVTGDFQAYTVRDEVVLSNSAGASQTLVFGGAVAGDRFEIRNVSVEQIGCVMDLNPAGMTRTKWLDASGNGLHGVVTGPTVEGKPSYDEFGTVWIGAGSIIPCTTNGAGPGTIEYPVSGNNVDVLDFDGGAVAERGQFSLVMPEDWDGGTVKAKFYWTNASGASPGDTVEWAVKAGALSDSDAMDSALGTAQVASDVLLADGDLHVTPATPAVAIAGTPAEGDLIQFEVYRNTSGTDDMSEDARLIGCLIQYRKTITETEEWV